MEQKRIVIYQVLPRIFGNQNLTNKKNGTIEENGCGKLADFTPEALLSIRELGVSHVWYTGIIEHAQQTDYSAFNIARDCPDVVKGKAGSPYAIKDYYDVDPDLSTSVNSRVAEFEALVKRTREAGMKVIIDLVPNHVARQYISDVSPPGTVDFGVNDDITKPFDKDNNFYYIPGTVFISPDKENKPRWHEEPTKATGNDCFTPTPSPYDWYETVKLNYGLDYTSNTTPGFKPEPDTWRKMKEVVLYWAAKGVDAFRCDMAAMVPLQFFSWLISETRKKYPDLMFIAEVYDPSKYNDYIFRGGFDYLYDKMVFYDTARAIMEGKAPANKLSDVWKATEGLHNFLLYFLENHDEQRLASDFIVSNGLKAIPAITVAATMFNNPLLVYFGQELGEKGMNNEGFSGVDGRTTIFDYWGLELINQWRGDGSWNATDLPPDNKKLREFYKKLLNLLHDNPALNKGRFYDLTWANTGNDHFDTSKLFSFIRYRGNNVLLVIVNFGEHDISYSLKIPSDARLSVGLDKELPYSGEDLLGLNETIIISGTDVENKGIEGVLKTCSAAIFKLVATL